MKNIEKYIFPIALLIGGVVLLVVGLNIYCEGGVGRGAPSTNTTTPTVIMIIGTVLIIIGIALYCYNFKDKAETDKWCTKAAEKGDAEAQCTMGVCYHYGYGVEQDYEEAAKWFSKAADQGLAEAQFNLGVCYENGYGVQKNLDEAVKWYHKAAVQGFAPTPRSIRKIRT